MEGLALQTSIQDARQSESTPMGLSAFEEDAEIQRYPEFPMQTVLPYALSVSKMLEESLQSFWNLAVPARLFSISTSPHYYWHMQDFYVAQKGLDETGTRWAQLRISEGLCKLLFETTLGKSQSDADFELSHLRNFEVFLLERFSRTVFQSVSPTLIKRPKSTSPADVREPAVHFVWLMPGTADMSSQIILSIPQPCVRTDFTASPDNRPIEDIPEPRHWKLAESNFLHAGSDVALIAGFTRARLDELKQLEPDDIILLENSKSDTWMVAFNQDDVSFSFPISTPSHKHLPYYPQVQGSDAMPDATKTPSKTIWDNLEVDVTAAFRPIKIPLKQLKEMEQGLVIEVGDLMDNKIHIEVEGHPVAYGELLVLGDKFGVRIEGLFDTVEATQIKQSQASGQVPAPSSENSEDSQDDWHAGEDNNTEESGPQEGQEEASGEDLMGLEEDDFGDFDDDEDWS